MNDLIDCRKSDKIPQIYTGLYNYKVNHNVLSVTHGVTLLKTYEAKGCDV